VEITEYLQYLLATLVFASSTSQTDSEPSGPKRPGAMFDAAKMKILDS
jgi:hypothetical protein